MGFHKQILTAAILLLFAAGLPFAPSIIPQLRVAHASTRTVTLLGALNGWNNSIPGPTLTAIQGDTINLVLSQPDTQHRFYVDVNNNQNPDCPTPDSCGPFYTSPTSYNFTVNYSPGTYTYYCSIHTYMKGTFNVEGFTITPSPSSLTLTRGSSQTSTLTVASQGGFSGTVNLSVSNHPSGTTVQFLTSPTIPVSPSNAGTATLNVTAGSTIPGGSYTVSIIGSNGTISATNDIAVTIVVPDFGMGFASSSLSITVGSFGTSRITLTSQNGFTGRVNLTATVAPPGPVVSLNPQFVTLSSGGTANSTLSIGDTTGISPNSYTINVTATGGSSVSHSATFTLVLMPQASVPPTLPALTIAIIGATIVAVVAVGAYAFLKRRPKK